MTVATTSDDRSRNSSMMNITGLIRTAAERWPHRPALIDEHGTIDYETLQRRIEATQVRFAALGVRPGHGVAVRLEDGWQFVVTALGAVACGAVVMPMSTRLTHRELTASLASASIHVLVDSGRAPSTVEGKVHALALTGREILRATWLAPAPDRSVTDLVPDAAFVRFTSGTTGRCKGVVLSHGAIEERTDAANRGLALGHEDTVLWVLPMAYHFFVSILLYLRNGVSVVVCRDHLAQSLLGMARRHAATFLYASPLHCRWLAADPSDADFPAGMRVISTSTGLDARTARSFRRRFGFPVIQAYGVIEVGLPIVNVEGAEGKPRSVGRPLPDFEVGILDGSLRRAPDGEVGQIGIRGPGMFAAYLDPPRLRSEVLRDGWFLTADLARRDADGDITIVGRCSSVINVAGEKVFPEEVQEVLNLHPAIARSRVHGRKSARTGESVHAEIELRANTPTTAEEVIGFCSHRLSSFKVPQSLNIVERILETPSGKIRQC